MLTSSLNSLILSGEFAAFERRSTYLITVSLSLTMVGAARNDAKIRDNGNIQACTDEVAGLSRCKHWLAFEGTKIKISTW